MILMAVELAKEFRAVHKPRIEGDQGMGEEKENRPRGNQAKFFVTLAWIAGLAVMLWLFGLVIVLPLFTFLYIKMQGEKWLWAISLSLVMLAVVYVGFGLLLHLQLYEGLLFQ